MTQPLKTRWSKAQKDQLNSARQGQEIVASIAEPVSESQAAEDQLVHAMDQLHIAQDKAKDLYGALRVERRKCQRTAARKKKLEKHIMLLQSVELPNAKGDAARAIQLLEETKTENSRLQRELSHVMEKCARAAIQQETKHGALKEKLAKSQRTKSNLQKCYNRFPAIKSKAVDQAKHNVQKENKTFNMLHKGTYSAESRQLARLLTKAGCSREYVGQVIQAVCQSAGITVKGKMSQRTVSRAILEGGIAAKIQLGYEVTQAKGFTVSGDGTKNKHVDYEGKHINVAVPSLSNNDDSTVHHHNRLVGINSSADQSAEAGAQEWKDQIADFLEVYVNSPFSKRSGAFARLVDILAKLLGMNTDHCTKEKKIARLIGDEKFAAIRVLLGEQVLSEKSTDEEAAIFEKARAEMIEQAGGLEAWTALSEIECADLTEAMVKDVLISVGETEYGTLSKEEQRSLDFFIWVGCGCHKDLNTVKGGNVAMMAWWLENDIEGPILLANKDNAAVLQRIQSEADVTPIEQRAIDATSHGGIKAASIAGAIFNNKDDKKGQQDTYKFWFEAQGILFNFPDTNNT
jgi:hypothetical protein